MFRECACGVHEWDFVSSLGLEWGRTFLLFGVGRLCRAAFWAGAFVTVIPSDGMWFVFKL